MLIYGAGGHARIVLSILDTCGAGVSGVFDDRPVATLLPYDPLFEPMEPLIVAIGDNAARRRIAGKVSHRFGNAIHPSALVDNSVLLGRGVVVVHRAVVQAGSLVGNHVIVNTGAIVDHECILEDFIHIGPGATLCGGVHVGEGTLIGAGSVVLPGIRIGRQCVIGAGSIVIRDLPDFAKVAGNPARSI